MKKLISALLAVTKLFSLAACGTGDATGKSDDLKVGFIFLHDENSTYDKNFMDAAKAVQQELGLSDDQVMFKTNIPESSEWF